MKRMRTFLTTDWGLRVPLIGAPMSPQAGGHLAAALAKAGAIGMIGVAAAQSTEKLMADVDDFRRSTKDLPFGIGLMGWVLNTRPELLDAALDAKPFAIALSFGDPAAYARRIRDAGVQLIVQVQDGESAIRAEAAGATLVVAQGTEAGGHTGRVGTLPLLQVVMDAVRIPVVAAGGIATGRALAAVLAAGAQGAWIGTPLLVSQEARNSAVARQRLIGAAETDTVLTNVFDVAQRIPWPEHFHGRALKNTFTDQWDGRTGELASDVSARERFAIAKDAEDFDTAFLYAGQSVGLLHQVESAADIVERIALEAADCLRAAADILTE